MTISDAEKARIDEAAAREVAKAPPLSPAVRDRASLILRPILQKKRTAA